MQTKGFIYHLVPNREWEVALERQRYKPESLKNEGFVHCSTREQLMESARLHFPDEQELVVLFVLVKKVKQHLKWEEGRNGELFPHLYADLHFEDVESSALIGKQADGTWDWE